MSVSVIVPTYNGAKKILNTLQALEKQTFKAFEVIVVIDGSSDDTAEMLKSKVFDFQQFTIIEQENRGRAGSRNQGAAEALGELLIFFDDDIRPVSECIRLHLQHHHQFPGTLAVGNVPEDLEKSLTDFQQYKAFLSRKWTAPLTQNNGLIDPEKPFLTAANFSVSKKMFEKLGGFDNTLTDSEDFDLAVRASALKVPIYFLADALGWHDDFVTCRSYIRRLRQYTQSHAMLRNQKPDLYGKFIFNQPSKVSFFKKLIYAFFSQNFWITLIDTTDFLRILPRFHRYKLYDLITTGLSVYFPDKKI